MFYSWLSLDWLSALNTTPALVLLDLSEQVSRITNILKILSLTFYQVRPEISCHHIQNQDENYQSLATNLVICVLSQFYSSLLFNVNKFVTIYWPDVLSLKKLWTYVFYCSFISDVVDTHFLTSRSFAARKSLWSYHRFRPA